MEVREEEQVEEEGREKVRHTREPACIAVLTVLPKLRGSSGYTTSKLSPHYTWEGEARAEEGREEEEQVEEGREDVGDTRVPACLAVLTVLSKLRGSSGYTTSNLNTTPH